MAGVAHSGEELVERLADWQPDVVVLDLLMPGGMDGVATMRRLTRDFPGIRVVALTASTDDARMQAVLRAGALGYVRKDADPELLLAAVRAVASGRRFIANSATSIDLAAHLSPREMEVLRELASGRSNRDVAARLSRVAGDDQVARRKPAVQAATAQSDSPGRARCEGGADRDGGRLISLSEDAALYGITLVRSEVLAT